jgi:hypothetical protein
MDDAEDLEQTNRSTRVLFSDRRGKNLNADVKMCRVTSEAYIELD